MTTLVLKPALGCDATNFPSHSSKIRMGERRYNEKEMASILRLAATAQAESSGTNARDSDFSLTEIMHIGTEVGIDPKQITLAAQDLAQRPGQKAAPGLFGARPVEVHERTVDGYLTDEAWADLVEELRTMFASDGAITTSANAREWAGGTDTVSVHLTSTFRNGHTRIRLNVRRLGGILVGWMIGFPVMFIFALVLGIWMNKTGADWFATMLAILPSILVIFGLTRLGVVRWAKASQESVKLLMDRLETLPQAAPMGVPSHPTILDEKSERISEHH